MKYSFERCKDPETGAVNKPVFDAVDTIETPDDYTVIVKMAKVNAPFLARVAENGAGVVMPEGSGDEQGKHPVGCGPFEFVSREFGNKVILKRFDDYWRRPGLSRWRRGARDHRADGAPDRPADRRART